jgi:ATP-dependent Lhr-like helicase
VLAALAALQTEGSVMCGSYRNDTPAQQWCERGLLARIHRATLDRLRREIEPVSRADFMRFLFRWQRADGHEPYRGATGLLAALEQLAGYSAAAGSWELELLPLRVEGYEPEWLDRLCLSGAASWGRIHARTSEANRTRLSRATPIAIAPRVQLASLRGAVASLDGLSADAQRVFDVLNEHGASFAEELRSHTRLLPSQLDVALGELVARGLAGSDAYAGLRALLIPAQRRGCKRHAKIDAMQALAAAGRWSRAPEPDTSTQATRERTEAFARALLRRYGVVFRALLARELAPPPWRDLLRVYRRLEANGEVRGGRFVDGFSGEQYALPDAVSGLRSARRAEPTGKLIAVSAVDPLCLLGIVLPGERVPAVAQARVLLRDGLPVAVRERGQVRHLDPPPSEAARWDAEVLLRRQDIPAALRPYVAV